MKSIVNVRANRCFATGELLKPQKVSNIDAPTYSQPVCTALQIALVDLLFSFGVVPSAVVGHSSGEIAAA